MTLKQMMQDKKVKLVELAKHLSIDPSQASLITNGWKKLPEKHVKRIASILKVSEETVRRAAVRPD